MKETLVQLGLLLLIAAIPHPAISQERIEYVPENVELILFSEFIATDIYDSATPSNHPKFVIPPIDDDTNALLWHIVVTDKIDNMIEVYFWRLDEDFQVVDTNYRGWISMDNIAVYPTDRLSAFELFDTPNATHCVFSYIEFYEPALVGPNGQLKVVDVDLESKWVKIRWYDQKSYWISYKNQCTDHITYCTGN